MISLLVGDSVTIYGANPTIFNGTFSVTSRISATVFSYQISAPAPNSPQGNILMSVDLNKGKSDEESINNSIAQFTTNVQNTFFNSNYSYIALQQVFQTINWSVHWVCSTPRKPKKVK